jgi:hypothetical protein
MDMALRRGPRLKVVKMKKRPELVLSVVNSAACLLKSYSHLKKNGCSSSNSLWNRIRAIDTKVIVDSISPAENTVIVSVCKVKWFFLIGV